MAGKRRRLLYDELSALGDDQIGEIVGGELFASPRPRPRHSHAAVSLLSALTPIYDFRRRGNGWWFLIEPELHLEGDVLVPDLAAWRHQRAPLNDDSAGVTVVPDWICEILSPSTKFLDQKRKMPAYARHQLPWLWLVDPETRQLHVFSRDGLQWRAESSWQGNETVSAPPFDEIALSLAMLWLMPATGGESS